MKPYQAARLATHHRCSATKERPMPKTKDQIDPRVQRALECDRRGYHDWMYTPPQTPRGRAIRRCQHCGATYSVWPQEK